MTQQAIILPCAKGSEQVLAEEAAALGLENPRIGVSVVSGYGDLQTAYQLCLGSRVASRVLWVLSEGEITNPDELYELTASVPWDDHLSADNTFAVRFNGIGCGIRNTQFGGLKVKDAVVDVLRSKLHRRPDVDSKNPDISIEAHLRKGKVTLALDLSGGALHQRGYRQAQGVAPIKEHLAATLLYRAQWPKLAAQGASLIDPMCGAGTLLIEAIMMAADVAPGLQRERFGFEHWQSHVPAQWRRLRDEANARAEAGLAAIKNKIYGFDQDGRTLAAARANIAAAGFESLIHLERRSVADLRAQPAYGQQGLLLSNPPYGERIGELPDLIATYEALGQAFKTFPADWHMALISSNQDMLKRLHLRSDKTYQAFNGAIESRIALYLRASQPEDADESAAPDAPKLSDQAQMFANRLRKNVKSGRKAAAKRGTNAWRVYDQDMPEYAFAIDVYADWAHVQEYAPPKTIDPDKARQRVYDVVQVIPEVLDIPAEHVVLKTRARQSGKQQYQQREAREQWFGVQEGAATLLVNLYDYLDTGLFLDHRLMRERLSREAEGKRVLNLFCYTASASVHAALGGASYTTSVDLSQTYLDWAQRNFDANGLSDRHRLIKADVMRWIAEGQSEFDLIFCDPPTFSNTKKEDRVFDVQHDQRTLIDACMRRLAKGGTLYFSNNYRGFKLDEAISEAYHVEEISPATIDFDFQRRPNIHRVWAITHKS
ncbi:bifunctional 23S rRNA (guanine(2069)-N(7))-methyltransferase RlmK/23S rRNA (guanine(2445)-N(2))-methyltransferase RlmL [Suttonella sp. R2A3]|uniref:bifunctional 23S rRNA (guanine(2069)-N(7))-methyltransferase RlmK/23S rRNA (guanine(2445)-N(2))-methyltransferase RlmL n=1 Tax=Suttonella sp. R2A3 TaxID=2908648 RepID=UPI001F3E0AAB|nr:bifunctional 23S rRNA (guanine(2069)-N(7))-methyltransferase RlmK/23S rRNA (guanine(2445)-N(2))-methyltransferase RlmL [Suttonella sp. R2A3]UJF24260.1 bifunctional 23S rRNA (guanine(2069)-N(7))-methyltransferase RlmK/23S rRNA (guanine(2445)-N(2))-methyltransferase RlmL [Suttonella sp. R2A3]